MPFRALTTATAQAAPVTLLGAPLVDVGETLLSLRDELNLDLGDRDDVDTTRLNRWINKAYRHLAASLDIQELHGSLIINTVVDQPFYLLPKQVHWITDLAISDEDNYPSEEGRQLSLIDRIGYRRLPVHDSGTPTKFFRFNKMLVIYPDPDDVYPLALDFKIRPDDMTADNHSPLLPVEWHEPLGLRAHRVALRSLRLHREGAVAQNNYVEAIRPMLDAEAEERTSMEAHVSPAREVRDTYRNRRH